MQLTSSSTVIIFVIWYLKPGFYKPYQFSSVQFISGQLFISRSPLQREACILQTAPRCSEGPGFTNPISSIQFSSVHFSSVSHFKEPAAAAGLYFTNRDPCRGQYVLAVHFKHPAAARGTPKQRQAWILQTLSVQFSSVQFNQLFISNTPLQREAWILQTLSVQSGVHFKDHDPYRGQCMLAEGPLF